MNEGFGAQGRDDEVAWSGPRVGKVAQAAEWVVALFTRPSMQAWHTG